MQTWLAKLAMRTGPWDGVDIPRCRSCITLMLNSLKCSVKHKFHGASTTQGPEYNMSEFLNKVVFHREYLPNHPVIKYCSLFVIYFYPSGYFLFIYSHTRLTKETPASVESSC